MPDLGSKGLAKVLTIMAVASAIGLGASAQSLLLRGHPLSTALWLWGAAVAIFLLGIRLSSRTNARSLAATSETADIERGKLSPRTEATLVILILLFGLFLRVYRIGSIPDGLNHDAAWNGLHAIRITNGQAWAPYVAEAWGRETMFHYMVACSQILFGQTQFAIQTTSVAIGVVTLGAFYLFVRRLFNTHLALVATFLLSVSGWHLTFSKVGWRSVLVPLFATLVCYFIAKATEDRRFRDFVLAGIVLGLSLYTYDAARVLPFVVVVFLGLEIARDRALLKNNYLGLLAFAASFVLAFAWLGWYALGHWDEFTLRGRTLWVGSQIESAGSIEPLFINLKNAVLMFNFRANGNDFFVTEPLLDLPMSVFFVLGFVIALFRIRQRAYLLLMTLLALGLGVSIASVPNGNRAIVTMPAIIASSAVFLVEVWEWLRWAYPRHQTWIHVGLVLVLLYVAYATFDSYLGPVRRTQKGFFPETSVVGRYIHDVAADNVVYAAAGNWAADTLSYLSYQGEGNPFLLEYTYTEVARDLLLFQPASGRGTVFIIKEHSAGSEVVAILQQRFPSATTSQLRMDDGELIASIVTVPPAGGVGADFSAYVSPGADERDTERRSDLDAIAQALFTHRAETGAVPATDGYLEVACAQGESGPLCSLPGALEATIFADPRGRFVRYGYWYISDGNSFTLFASFEQPLPLEESCSSVDPALRFEPSVYCIQG